MDSASFFNFIIASSSSPVKLSKKSSRMSRTFLVFHHNPEQYLSNAFAMRGQAHGENRDTGRNLTISPFFYFSSNFWNWIFSIFATCAINWDYAVVVIVSNPNSVAFIWFYQNTSYTGHFSISIHSLRVEGDCWRRFFIHGTLSFQSTPSVWKETGARVWYSQE